MSFTPLFPKKSPLSIEIFLKDREGKPEAFDIQHNEVIKHPIYLLEDDNVSGSIRISRKENNSKPFAYARIHIELKAHLQDRQSELCFCYMKKGQQLDTEGAVDGRKEYEFSFTNFERPAETFKGQLGEIRCYLKVVVTPKSGQPIIEEKDIVIYKNEDRQVIRLGMVNITRQERHVMTVHTDKRFYFPSQHLVGKLDIISNHSKPKKLTLELLQEEFFNIKPDSKVCSTMFQVIDQIDLAPNLPIFDDDDNAGEIKSIPFKINLEKYNLSPTLNFSMGKAKYIVTHALRVNVTEDTGLAWTSKMRLVIFREKDVI